MLTKLPNHAIAWTNSLSISVCRYPSVVAAYEREALVLEVEIESSCRRLTSGMEKVAKVSSLVLRLVCRTAGIANRHLSQVRSFLANCHTRREAGDQELCRSSCTTAAC